MTTFAPSSGRAARARIGSAVLWLLACGSVAACSLIAPSDEHFMRVPSAPRGEAGESGESSVAGQAGDSTGAGGVDSLGGAGGEAGFDAAGAGSEAALICADDSADCNHEASDGCEIDLSSSHGNCGGCGEAFACTADEVCQQRECTSVSGCSDGTREGFSPESTWPNLAGCTAKWPKASLRAAKVGGACGYESAECVVPADACGNGWHVCGIPPFGPAEINSQATQEECAAQPGAFAAAIGDQYCEPCSAEGAGAACCGERCVQQNGSCIYPGKTAWFGVINNYVNLCAAIESNVVQHGVLCCKTLDP